MKTQAQTADNVRSIRNLNRLRRLTLCVAVATCFAAPAWSLPTGSSVIAGQANISQSGSTLNIANTPGAIINWANFSVGALESVRFQQQSALSSVLNRVTGTESSAIYGALSSNGRVWLINPNGILFGGGSRVDIPGFIASTLNVSDSDFLAGKMNFTAGATAGSLRNEGTLTNGGAGGNIYLVAPDIENSGVIRAINGEVLLAAGRQVSLVDSAHPDIQVVVSAPDDKAVNLGEIVTQNGRISLFGAILQQKGRLSADSVEVDDHGRIVFRGSQKVELAQGSTTTAGGQTGGSISIRNQGDTFVSGTVSATGSQGKGGTVEVLGNRVAVMDRALIDASGETGGGRVMVGGDYQGKNPDVPNSTITYFGPDATLKTNAAKVGDGGTAIIWANDTTRAFGTIEAKGGTQTGNGGFVETSGHHLETHGIRVSTSAASGVAGGWLLDPYDVTIDGNPTDANYGGFTGTGDYTGFTFAPSGSPSNVYAGDIESNLAGGSVYITTGTVQLGSESGNITVNAPVTWSSVYSLNLNAAGSIVVNRSLIGYELVLNASGDITVNAPITMTGNYNYYSVDMQSTGGRIITTATGVIQGKQHGRLRANGNLIIGGAVTIDGGEGNAVLISDVGNVSINAAVSGIGDGTDAEWVNDGFVEISAPSGTISGSGLITAMSTDATTAPSSSAASGKVSLTANSGINVKTQAMGSVNAINSGPGNVSIASSGPLTVFGDQYGGDAIQAVNGSVTLTASNLNVDGGYVWADSGNATINATGSVNISNGGEIFGFNDVVLNLKGASSTVVAYGGRIYADNFNSGAATFINFATRTSGGVSLLDPNSITHYGGQGYLPSTVANGFLVITYPNPATTYSVNTILVSGSPSHTYGTTPDAVFGYTLSKPLQSGEKMVSSTAVFTPTISSLTSTGTFTVQYSSGLSTNYKSTFNLGTGLTYTVNPALLTLSLTGVTANNKVYDGSTFASFSGGNLVGLVNNDAVSFTMAGDFADRHAATAKTVTLTGATLDGAAANNYTLAPVNTTGSYKADITQLGSVTWTGQGKAGLWSDPANWGGALPDGNNVLAVIIPTGGRVTFDTEASLQTLSSLGDIMLAKGTLNVEQSLSVADFSQTGGSYSGSGNFSVGGNFNMIAGQFTSSGPFSASGFSLTGGSYTGSGNFTISDAFNRSGGLFTTSGPIRVNQASGSLLFTHDAPVQIYRLTAPHGSVTLVNTGATTITGEGILAAGDINATAKSPLTIDGPLTSTSGGVSLTASYPGQLTLTPAASFSAPGTIELAGTGPIIGTLPAGAVVFDNSSCILNPALCDVTPPPDTQTAIDNALIQININQQSVIETTIMNSTKPIDLLARNESGGASGSGQPSGDPNVDKKQDEKETIAAIEPGAKKDEPVKKMYCN